MGFEEISSKKENPLLCDSMEVIDNSEEDVSHLYRWRVPYLLTGGEHISPASLKRQEEALPMAKLEQWRYNVRRNHDG